MLHLRPVFKCFSRSGNCLISRSDNECRLKLSPCGKFRIYFRYNHRNIRCPAVCTVVRNNRCLGFCIIFFNLFDFFFCHIYSTKNKINFAADCLNIIYIFYNYIFYRFRHRFLHFPAAAYCLFICFLHFLDLLQLLLLQTKGDSPTAK